jgi:hypothetical protein
MYAWLSCELLNDQTLLVLGAHDGFRPQAAKCIP